MAYCPLVINFLSRTTEISSYLLPTLQVQLILNLLLKIKLKLPHLLDGQILLFTYYERAISRFIPFVLLQLQLDKSEVVVHPYDDTKK